MNLRMVGYGDGHFSSFKNRGPSFAIPDDLEIYDNDPSPNLLLKVDESSGLVTVQNSLLVSGNVTVSGNFTVLGDPVELETQILTVKDNFIVCNSGPSGTGDAGYLTGRYQTENDASLGDVIADTPDETGTATGGGSDYIDLGGGASGVDDYYNGWWLHVTSGTGSGQVREVLDYKGDGLKRVTVTGWSVTPDGTSNYSLFSRTYIASYYDETNDRWAIGSTAMDPAADSSISPISFVDLRVGDITADSLFSPSAGGADLGSTASEWGSIYQASDKYHYMGSGQESWIVWDTAGPKLVVYSGTEIQLAGAAGLELSAGSGTIDIFDSVIPNSQLDLGSAANGWADFYQGDDRKHYFGDDQDGYLEFFSGGGLLKMYADAVVSIQSPSDSIQLLTPIIYLNAATISVSGNLLPSGARDIGSPTAEWQNVYQDDDVYHYWGDAQDGYIRWNDASSKLEMATTSGHIEVSTGGFYLEGAGNFLQHVGIVTGSEPGLSPNGKGRQ